MNGGMLIFIASVDDNAFATAKAAEGSMNAQPSSSSLSRVIADSSCRAQLSQGSPRHSRLHGNPPVWIPSSPCARDSGTGVEDRQSPLRV